MLFYKYSKFPLIWIIILCNKKSFYIKINLLKYSKGIIWISELIYYIRTIKFRTYDNYVCNRALVESEPGLNLALINRLETLNHKVSIHSPTFYRFYVFWGEKHVYK